MKSIELLSFDQRLTILSMIRERKDDCREKLRYADTKFHKFWIGELTKLRNLKKLLTY